MPPLTAAAKLKPSFSGTWRLLGEAAGLVVDLPDEVVGQLPVPGCLLADAGEGVVQVVLQLSIAFGNAGGCFVDTGQVTHTT